MRMECAQVRTSIYIYTYYLGNKNRNYTFFEGFLCMYTYIYIYREREMHYPSIETLCIISMRVYVFDQFNSRQPD